MYFFVTLIYGKKPRIITRDNITYEVDLSEGIELSLFVFGSYQKHVTENKLLKLPKDAIIIDVGANCGLMTLPFAQLVPEGKVYAFEPTHYALEKLKRNISLNPELARRIEVINSFVSAKSTENANITAYSSWKLNNKRTEIVHNTHLGTLKSAEGVPSVTLDDFCKNTNLSRLDFIKIDTDGHEYEVLQGARKVIAQYHPQIIFEIGHYILKEKGIDGSMYSSFFEQLNYRLYDAAKETLITLENYKTHIPAKSTVDIIAIPQ